MNLYHFTCTDHGQPGIEADGFLRPRLHPLLPEIGPVTWFTELPEPDRDAVGLTSSTLLTCDRMAVRYELPADSVPDLMWWPFLRERCRRATVADLERYGRPLHWWISRAPVPV